MPIKTAKIFSFGQCQAVRLPKEFHFDTKEVYISRQGESVVISSKKPTWDDFFDLESAFDDDFLKNREDSYPQERDFEVGII